MAVKAAAPASTAVGRRVGIGRKTLELILLYTLLVVIAMIILLPLAWMFVTSIKPKNELFTKNPQ